MEAGIIHNKMKTNFYPCAVWRTALRTALCATVALSCATSSPVHAAPRVAPSYTDKADRYAVWLPSRPKMAQRKANMPGLGPVTVRYASATTPNVVYVVMATPLPNGALAHSSEVLGGIQQGLTTSTRARLISSRPISMGRYPGREAVLSMTPPKGSGVGTKRMQVRFYVAERRSYQVMALTSPAQTAKMKPQIQKVFSSFQILPQ